MNHPLVRWLIFGLCLIVLTGALSWITVRALSLEAQQEAAVAQARTREQVRLALWRMEAEASSVVVRESARPARHYQTFPQVDALLAETGKAPVSSQVREPSPFSARLPTS